MRMGPGLRAGGAVDGVRAVQLPDGGQCHGRVGDGSLGSTRALPQRDVHGPAGASPHGEFPRPVDGVDDPHPIGPHAGQVVDRLLGQDGVIGSVFCEPVENQRVGPGVAGVTQVVGVVEPDLLAQRQQHLTGFLRHVRGECRVGHSGGAGHVLRGSVTRAPGTERGRPSALRGSRPPSPSGSASVRRCRNRGGGARGGSRCAR